jgi:hypothetical protein
MFSKLNFVFKYTLKLEFGAFNYKIEFYNQVYYSTHCYMNASKHKSLYFQLIHSKSIFVTIDPFILY